jgi:hypothetical protein
LTYVRFFSVNTNECSAKGLFCREKGDFKTIINNNVDSIGDTIHSE